MFPLKWHQHKPTITIHHYPPSCKNLVAVPVNPPDLPLEVLPDIPEIPDFPNIMAEVSK